VNALSIPDMRVPGGPQAPARMRSLLDDELTGELSEERLAELRLLTTEVVSNSVRHGPVGPDGWVSCTASVGDDCLRVEIRDSSLSAGVPRQREPDYLDGGGFGLFLVDQVAASWGVEQDSGTCVWFELSLP
jgi:anti-sigma regulatory factor (Ser/Thr protein kinase)